MRTSNTSLTLAALFLSTLGLAACSSSSDEGSVHGGAGTGPAAGMEQGGTCIADQLQDRIGGPLLSSSAPPPAQGPFLRVSDLPHPQRILPPGSLVTHDFRPDRLNVMIDAVGRITQITCG
ncbi:I78 family peptidase inhibitor [Rhodospirillum sp. A1_3_36]|uniref:I78 family peptidase inhibitor n=1 Tax=Rhodospirillum sp. A1_3_36 TaxID=3391666 RepID=UPI0039A45955